MVLPWRLVGLALLTVTAVGGCGSDQDAAPADTTPGASVPRAPASPSTIPGPVAVLGVYENVEAYPACGNEPFDHLGVTWYPLVHVGSETASDDLQERVDEVLAVQREPAPVGGIDGLVRVAPPGPGDDVGTLVVWADGVARWVSDSRDLDVWLVDDPISYSWVC